MNATRGFLAKAWHHVACTQLETSGPDGIQHAQRNDGQPRVYHVVCKLHAMVTEIWKGRNEELHSRDQENAVLQRTAMDAEIARIHCAPSALPAADQHYCNHTLDHILRKPPTYKRRWLHRVRQAIDRNIKNQILQQRMTKYFNRVPTRSSDTITESKDYPISSPRITHHQRRPIRTTQQLLREFFQERAPNTADIQQSILRPLPH
jgi:hypothetical protein